MDNVSIKMSSNLFINIIIYIYMLEIIITGLKILGNSLCMSTKIKDFTT